MHDRIAAGQQAFDLRTGQVVWRKSYAAPFNKNQYAAKMAAGPFSTPLAAGGRVFTLGVMGVLTAWDAATGNVAWRKITETWIPTLEKVVAFCNGNVARRPVICRCVRHPQPPVVAKRFGH